MRSSILFLMLSLFLSQAWADELLTNGDFEEPLTTGWEQTLVGSDAIINRSTSHHPDPDYEAYAHKGTGDGYARLSQTVPVLGTDLSFAVSAKLSANATSTAWSAAAVVLTYFDENSYPLGETSVCYGSRYCPWESTPTFHMIILDPDVWVDHAFDLDEELTNLPGINPAEIRQIRVSLLAFVDDC